MAAQTDKRITLYTVGTPNGIPISVFFNELKDVYGGPEVETVKMSISDADIPKVEEVPNQVKRPWFLKINPNGRIPAITDNAKQFNVFETSAILLYLADNFDEKREFSYSPVDEPLLYSETLQWLFFAHGGVGPMQGQANHFNKYAPEKIPYAVNRYINETKRLYSVLDSRLADREYLVGHGKGKFTIADLKTYPWVKIYLHTGVTASEDEFKGLFPNVHAWLARIAARSAVKETYPKP